MLLFKAQAAIHSEMCKVFQSLLYLIRISFQEVCFRIKYRQTHPATDINPDSIRYHGIISSQYPTDRQSITGVRIGHQRSADRYRQAHSQIHLLFGKSLDKLTSIGFIHQRIFP